jgi:hypothetical protein
VGREWTVADLAEAVFYLMAVDQRSDGDAAKVAEILEEWMGRTQNANLRRAGVEADEKTNDPASDCEATTEGEKKKGRWESALRGYNQSQSTILCVATQKRHRRGARNGPAQPESIGRADGGRRWRVRVGEHG